MSAAGPGQLLFAFVRHWSRRAGVGDAALAEQGRLVLVTEAVAALNGRAEPATVNAVADEIGIDQSGASRLIRSAVDAGHLTITTAPSDGRRREVSVTPAGRTALRHAHAWQERIFAELTAGWDQQQRDDFRNAMADLITRSAAIGGSVAPARR
ncbi:MarR family winged helix-turn-helix transcriptional regulator [Plantactinospora siamensis]|uniref:MarR family winged helix-turn-helix transcriptional regulator n=1 Tax=Plantactinospora siamensis TaxID=555372 RepID=A0ABV6P3Q0_9ACTN